MGWSHLHRNPEQVRGGHASTALGSGAAQGEDRGDFARPPSIAPPKGGGAIRGIGEKFAANPVTGTGSLSVPIATSPGRAGFGSQLALSYDSGAGNGAFGLGWSVALPAITRKTDKGLPRYLDAEESDGFILSGSEDLVPVLEENAGDWVRQTVPPRTVDSRTYRIQRYCPRIEGLFARIERWTNQADSSDSFWRSISKDNITSWYGKNTESRIADPADPSRVFSWLICESYDHKGNVISYGYKREDSVNVDRTLVHEANRTDESRSANRYLKCIRYGNRTPYLPEISENNPATPLPSEWMFEVVFDYGEHDPDNPSPNDGGIWPIRSDPFSSYRAGFEIRTYRLCQRVLLFHHFPNEDGVGADCLVRSTDFHYRHEQDPADQRNPIHTVLASVTQCAYRRAADGYRKQTLPSVEFDDSQAEIHEEIRDLDSGSLENLPRGLDNALYQWVDLDGDGLSGILTEQGSAWFYKRNLSPVNVATDNAGRTVTRASLAPLERVSAIPSLAALGNGRQQLLDLADDGQLDLVEFDSPRPGFFERTADADWIPFKPFESLPILNWSDPNLRFVDLTGHVSLRQLDPAALLSLKATGACEVTIPEWLFDLDAPGHYMRRIKNVNLSIPAVTGPYTSVNCTLSLLKSTLRRSPPLGDGEYPRASDEEDTRFVDYYGTVQSIVTSSAQNDGGMFETNLRDERFLPFEGHGVVSTWRLELPAEFRQFKYNTISDVILHFRYTARQGGVLLGEKAVEHTRTLVEEADTSGLVQLFSLRHDFPTQWHQFVTGEGNFVAVIKKEYFPYFVQGEDTEISKVEVHAIRNDELLSGDANGLNVGDLTTAPQDNNEFEISLAEDDLLNRDKGAHIFFVMKYTME